MALLVYFTLRPEAYLTKVCYKASWDVNRVVFRHCVETNKRHFPRRSEQPSHRTPSLWGAKLVLFLFNETIYNLKKCMAQGRTIEHNKNGVAVSRSHWAGSVYSLQRRLINSVTPKRERRIREGLKRFPTHEIAPRFGFVLYALGGTIEL